LSPQIASTKLAWIAKKSRRKGLRSDGQQQSCRLWARPLQVLGPQGPSLTNRVSELFTHGSVGGGGSNPAPYPALDAAMTLLSHAIAHRRGASEFFRWQERPAPKMKQRTNRLSALIDANRISGDERGLAVRIPGGLVPSAVRNSANKAAPADGGSGTCFHFVARWPAAAEPQRSAKTSKRRTPI
jgi:hypothetical protein